VTPTVVSRVLHNKAIAIRVSDATAERIRAAANDLGYRVNVLARNFRGRKTFMIGVLHGVGFPRPAFARGSPYFGLLMDGIVEGAFQRGYSVTLCPKLMGDQPEDAISDGRFDGILWYSTAVNEENRRMLERCADPLVLVHTPSHEFGGRFSSVTCDNRQGLTFAVEHLYNLGHRRIGFLHRRECLFSESETRLEAFREQMALRGIRVRPTDIVEIADDTSGLRDYFASHPRHTALISPTDDEAALTIHVAQEQGFAVPKDISVVGFDSTSFCLTVKPNLTSVAQPLYDIGRIAAGLLIDGLADPARPAEEIVLPCGFDIRDSTAPPR
jgi:LacI family transcriptional regulator